MRIKAKLAAAGVLATTLSMPLLLKKSSVDSPSLDLSELNSKGVDYRSKETNAAKNSYPTIREGLIELYEAEREQNKALAEGKIPTNPVQRRAAGFAGAGQELPDMGKGAVFQLIKKLEKKQEDGSIRVVTVNEHFEVNEQTGAILGPKYIRARVLIPGKKKEDLHQPAAHLLFKTAMYQMVWIEGKGLYPVPQIAQQHFYEDFDLKQNLNPFGQTELLVGPLECISCHRITENNIHTKHIFDEARKLNRKINYGIFIQEWEFEDPNQPGLIEYRKWLREKVDKGELKEEFVRAAEKDAQDFRNFEISGMIEALKEAKEGIPWIGSDKKVSKSGRSTYTDSDGTIWERAVYPRFNWPKNDHQFIPRNRNKSNRK